MVKYVFIENTFFISKRFFIDNQSAGARAPARAPADLYNFFWKNVGFFIRLCFPLKTSFLNELGSFSFPGQF